jgi:hypothetical protein
LLLAACVDQQPGSASGDRPLFVIACTHAPPAGAADRNPSAPTTVIVTAREITVAPRPPGTELSWAGRNQTAEPERTYIPPGQRCSIYRTF